MACTYHDANCITVRNRGVQLSLLWRFRPKSPEGILIPNAHSMYQLGFNTVFCARPAETTCTHDLCRRNQSSAEPQFQVRPRPGITRLERRDSIGTVRSVGPGAK